MHHLRMDTKLFIQFLIIALSVCDGFKRVQGESPENVGGAEHSNTSHHVYPRSFGMFAKPEHEGHHKASLFGHIGAVLSPVRGIIDHAKKFIPGHHQPPAKVPYDEDRHPGYPHHKEEHGHRPYQEEHGHSTYQEEHGHRPYQQEHGHRPYQQEHGHRPYQQEHGHRPYQERPNRPYQNRPNKPHHERPNRPYDERPHYERPHRPNHERPHYERPHRPHHDRPHRPHLERPQRPNQDRPSDDDYPDESYDDQPKKDRPYQPGQQPNRPDKQRPNRPNNQRPRPPIKEEVDEDYEDTKVDNKPPSWEDIGEHPNRDIPYEDIIQPRQRPKRFIESKIYHVPLQFRSNAKPYKVRFKKEKRVAKQ